MSSFTVPPLPGENLLTVTEVARRSRYSREAIYNAIEDAKLAAVRVAGRILVAESEAERFIRGRPSHNPPATKFWQDFRRWRAEQQQAAGRAA
jgi:hypothetical protein